MAGVCQVNVRFLARVYRVIVEISSSLLGGCATAPFGEHFYGYAIGPSKSIEKMTKAMGFKRGRLIAVADKKLEASLPLDI